MARKVKKMQILTAFMKKRPIGSGPGSAYAATVTAVLILLFLSFHSFFPAAAALNSGQDENRQDENSVAPKIEISSLSGRLDLDSPSTVALELFNNASHRGAVKKTALDPARASCIVAELTFDDNRIQVLSAPQMAGSLGPKESTTVEFMALAEGAEVGVYPAQLRLNYSHLERISTSGNDNAPYIIFNYEQLTKEIPLPVKVVLGPRIEIKEVKGAAIPGERSGLEVVVANEGDETAFDLQLEARAIPPFILEGDEWDEDEAIETKKNNKNSPAERQSSRVARLEAGSVASIDLVVFTDANATPGYCPLPCSISYLTAPPGREEDATLQGSERRENIALLVDVKEDSYLKTWYILPAGIAIILILAISYFYFLRNISGRSGRKRKPKKTALR